MHFRVWPDCLANLNAINLEMKIRIGINFKEIGTPSVDFDNWSSAGMEIKHWSIVLESGGEYGILELDTDGEKIFISDTPMDCAVASFELAIYMGEVEDIDEVLKHHPMRKTKFSLCYNNSQHFVATFFILLEAFAQSRRNRKFKYTGSFYDKVLGVLETKHGFLWNSPNVCLRNAGTIGQALGTAGTGAAVALSTATTTTVIPASGLAAFFGAAPTVAVVPAAFAPAAALAAPVLLGVTMLGKAVYQRKKTYWEEATKFLDPRVFGFPEGYKAPIGADERPPAAYGTRRQSGVSSMPHRPSPTPLLLSRNI